MAGFGNRDFGGCGWKPGDNHRNILDHQAMHFSRLLPQSQNHAHIVENARPDLHPGDQLDSHALMLGSDRRLPRHQTHQQRLRYTINNPIAINQRNSPVLNLCLSVFSVFRFGGYYRYARNELPYVLSNRLMLAQKLALRASLHLLLRNNRSSLLLSFAHQVPGRRVGSNRPLFYLPPRHVRLALRNRQALRVRCAEQGLGQLAPHAFRLLEPRDRPRPRNRSDQHRACLWHSCNLLPFHH